MCGFRRVFRWYVLVRRRRVYIGGYGLVMNNSRDLPGGWNRTDRTCDCLMTKFGVFCYTSKILFDESHRQRLSRHDRSLVESMHKIYTISSHDREDAWSRKQRIVRLSPPCSPLISKRDMLVGSELVNLVEQNSSWA
ncbi:hypothetical protein BD410DRAFT_154810 [Rickenella mellea]|uniref:Uncharacterized protein n=1 Tax=Rickenella mellea TaxID=50990 RepID=A0A4Y7PHK9_9AGAM|nr:hypothetical protein BD410DRAFT_154810 [Rickenella mellea]